MGILVRILSTQMVFALHEHLSCELSNHLFLRNRRYIMNIWTVWAYNEPLPHVVANHIWRRNFYHTESTCVVSFPHELLQYGLLMGLFLQNWNHKLDTKLVLLIFLFLWATLTCLSIRTWREKLLSHSKHWNAFFPSWTESICSFRTGLFENLDSQMEHLKGSYLASWLDSKCFTRLFLTEKLSSHSEM